MQKDQLAQDMLLLGPPGELRRRIALRFCEVAQREYEFISLSRDTTEADLKQRREIVGNSVRFVDQAAVRAAIEGRVLILEGIEKAERNILPLLNNLLENREMALEDGRFLMNAKRYDKLLETHTEAEMHRLGLIRVDPNFRVISLSLPVPRYAGNPLDPPLRSRFQAYSVPPLSLSSRIDTLSREAPSLSADTVKLLASAAEAFRHADTESFSELLAKPIEFTEEGLVSAARLLERFPHTATQDVLRRVYPSRWVAKDAAQADAIESAFKKLGVDMKSERAKGYAIASVRHEAPRHKLVTLTRESGREEAKVRVPSGPLPSVAPDSGAFVVTSHGGVLLQHMLEDHAIGRDMCIIGPKGSGKSTLVKQFAAMLGYETEHMMLFRDMSTRDLLQRRATKKIDRAKQAEALSQSSSARHREGLGLVASATDELVREESRIMGNNDALAESLREGEDSESMWEMSPLIRAAVNGRIAILDNIDRLPVGALSVLQSLIHERQVSLHDGTRLVSSETYGRLLSEHGLTQAELTANRVYAIHPAFRIIATGDLPSASHAYITQEVMSLFHFHHLPSLDNPVELERFLDRVALRRDGVDSVDNASSPARLDRAREQLAGLVRFNEALKQNKHLQIALSTRQLIRAGRRIANAERPATALDTRDVVHGLLLFDFLPAATKATVTKLLFKSLGGREPFSSHHAKEYAQECEKGNYDYLFSVGTFHDEARNAKALEGQSPSPSPFSPTGASSLAVEAPAAKAHPVHLIPDIDFFAIPSHVSLLQEMYKDYALGEHLLLIGPQGVGKNKLTDKFLQTLHLPRQYIQLHRDTTVSSLTLQPSLERGKIVWTDSPLVKAVKEGHVLVVDEADKAPPEVVVVLKSLVDGEMTLADGRRIVQSAHIAQQGSSSAPNEAEAVVAMHPNFRLIVLANKPGWPFLGNDFFRECGDLFSCHAIDNPDVASEMALLRAYAPSVPTETLSRLTRAFSHLRQLVDEGHLSYPYSSREAIAIARHLERFPGEPFEEALRNVFAFDVWSDSTVRESIVAAFKRSGFRVSNTFMQPPVELFEASQAGAGAGATAASGRRRPLRLNYEYDNDRQATKPKHGKVDPANSPHVGGNTWAGGSGGADTAGLGGKGGPYRLDSGHPVHQISDEEKRKVSKEVLEAAKAMAQEALQKKLQEIEMSEEDAVLYEDYAYAVKGQVSQLRTMLQGLQSKSKERQWLRRQTHGGELDEAQLVEAMAGEGAIFKRRGEELPPLGFSAGLKPKRIHFVMDVSGSMYRFNGFDGRLDRMLEAAVLVMESFTGFENRFKYSIGGHSGDSPNIPLVDTVKQPQNRRQRLAVLRRMAAHSQFCSSGDYTLTATELAIRELEKEEADEHFVIVVSDANLRRYGISPRTLGKILMREPKVQAHCIFIASLADEAERIAEEIPPGLAYVCLDSKGLPLALNKILTSKIIT